jgi:plastocyanin
MVLDPRRSRTSPILPVFSVILSLVIFGGCSTSFDPDDARAEQSVTIKLGASNAGNTGFSPNPVTVIRQTRVTWTNSDSVQHQIASTAGVFEGPPISNGQTYSYIFEVAASYRYYCLVDGHTEQGVINVTP